MMEDYRAKIKQPPDLKAEIDDLKSRGKKIVFTNGCFDILHRGHTRYLAAARAMGDYLVVAVNSDRSVRAIKGPERPITPEEERAELLAALESVDGVVIFEEEDPYRIIRYLVPEAVAGYISKKGARGG